MLRTISSSELRAQIKQVLNEVGYGQTQYIVEKFGEPTAVIVSLEDFRLIQAVRKQQTSASLREVIANIRSRSRQLEPEDLSRLISEARAEFYALQNSRPDAR